MINTQSWQSEESFRLLVEGVRDYAIFMLDTGGRVMSWNVGAERIMGYSQAEILGQHFSCFYPPEHTQSNKPQQELQLVRTVGCCEDEGVRIRKDGSTFWASMLISSLKQGRKLVGFSVIIHDLSERKQIEQELCNANRALRILCDCNQALVRASEESELLRDICQIIVDIGKYRACWVGLPTARDPHNIEIVARAGKHQDLQEVETSHLLPILTGTSLANGVPCLVQNILKDHKFRAWRKPALKNGYASLIALPLLGNSKDITGFSGTGAGLTDGVLTIYAAEPDAFNPQEVQLLTELTNDLAYGLLTLRARAELKAAEKALRESEERYRRLVELSPESIIVHSQGQIDLINPAGARLLGADVPEQLIGQPVANFIASHHQKTLTSPMPSGQNPPQVPFQEQTLLRLDGTEVFVESAAVALDSENQAVLVVGRDLTERKQMEATLRRSEELHRLTLSNISEAVFITTSTGEITYICPNIQYIFEYTQEEVQAMGNIFQILGENFFDINQLEKLGELHNIEREIICKTGEMRTLLVSVKRVSINTGTTLYTCRDISDRKQTQLALEESNRRIVNILESITDGFLALDHQWRVTFINRQGEQLLQKKRQEILGNNLWQLFYPPGNTIFYEKLHQAVSSGVAVSFEGFEQSLNTWFDIHAYPGEDGLTVYFQDITERKQAREALIESAHQLRAVFEAAMDAMVITDDTGHYIAINPAASNLLGIPPTEIIGRHIVEFIDENNFDFNRLWRYFLQKGRITGEVRVCRPNGEFFDADFSAVAHFLPGRHLGIVRDITQRKRTEEELRQYREQLEDIVEDRTRALTKAMEQLQRQIAERTRVEAALWRSQEQLTTLINASPDIICFKDGSGRWLLANQAILQVFGLENSHFIGLNDRQLAQGYNFYREAFLNCAISDETAWSHGTLCRGEEMIVSRDGQQKIYDVIKVPLFYPDGTRKGLVVLGRDITEHKRASEEVVRLASIVESSDDAIIGTTLEGTIISWNAGAENIYGYSAQEIKGRSSSILAQPEYPDELPRILERIGAGGRVKHYETMRVRKDGTQIQVSLTISPIFDPNGHISGVSTIARDITDRKLIEAALDQLRHQNELILTSAGEGICGLDAQAKITFINPAASRMLGYGIKELLGQSIHIILHSPCESSPPPSAADCLIYASLEDGSVHHVTDKLFWRKNGISFPVEYVSTPIREHDKIVGAVVTFKDITERLAVERMKNEFISIVSHELRTPLTSIRAAMGLLASGILNTQPEKAQRMLDIAVANTDRLVRLINDILDLERIGSGKISIERHWCNAGDLMLQAVESMQVMAQKAGVSLSVQPLNLPMWADSDRILQTLTNLLSNAIKFSSPGSTVCLTGSFVTQTGQLTLSVKDCGRGIPPEKLEIIFERFQQVDASDSRQKGGTGLGLAICRSIVEHHGGRIWAESSLGEGSTFSFSLPVAP